MGTTPLAGWALTAGLFIDRFYPDADSTGPDVRLRLAPKDRLMAKENDIVLIHVEDQPLRFARIEEILPDSKPDWYHVKLLMLQIPLQVVTWILRDRYIMGDAFTMNGKQMRLERVVSPESDGAGNDLYEKAPDKPPRPVKGKGTVISLADKRKR
jgi:hypothetical protein